jgi:hypothetical protein
MMVGDHDAHDRTVARFGIWPPFVMDRELVIILSGIGGVICYGPKYKWNQAA